MSFTVAIDPGRHVGWALGAEGRVLARGTLVDRELSRLPLLDVAEAVIEMPRVYPSASKWKGDPQEIVRLAFLAGRIAARYPVYILYEPRTWRGNAPDAVIERRTLLALREDEPRGDSPHSWDAIGLLLYRWRRFT